MFCIFLCIFISIVFILHIVCFVYLTTVANVHLFYFFTACVHCDYEQEVLSLFADAQIQDIIIHVYTDIV